MTDKRLTTADLARNGSDQSNDRENGGRQQTTTGLQERYEPLLQTDQADRFTTRWQEIQVGSVDEPRESVEQADALVADLMQRLASSFARSGSTSRAGGTR